MISYRQADLAKTKNLMDHTPMIVDMLHTSAGMTVLDHVYEKDKIYSQMIDEKIDHLKSIIRSQMQEMGIWFNRHQNHDRQQGFNNIRKIMNVVKEDPRVESVTENFTIEEANRNGLQHFIYTVVMK